MGEVRSISSENADQEAFILKRQGVENIFDWS